jgi:prophage regulatory protein
MAKWGLLRLRFWSLETVTKHRPFEAALIELREGVLRVRAELAASRTSLAEAVERLSDVLQAIETVNQLRPEPPPPERPHPLNVKPERLPRLLRAWDVAREIGVSRSTIWRMIQAGKFPKPVQLTGNAVAWKRNEVFAWIAARPTGRLPDRRQIVRPSKPR